MSSLSAPEISFRAQDHLRCLIYGVDPRTQQPITDAGVLSDVEVLRSLVFALEVLEQRPSVPRQVDPPQQGDRAGKPWSGAEDKIPITGFRNGERLDELRAKLQRSGEGIVARLARLKEVASRDEARTTFHRRLSNP